MHARRLIPLTVAAVALTACTHAPTADTTKPPASTPKADDVLAQVADAMTKLDATGAPLTSPDTYPNQDIKTITAGMDGLKPTVKAGTITYHPKDNTADGELQYTWPTFPKPWSYSTNARLVLVDKHWQWQYDPSVVQANLTGDTRLVATRLYADRGAIFGSTGPLVENRDVVDVGIDKTQVTDPGEQDASARALAKLLNMDADAYAAQVKNAGPQAFVLAQTVRGTSAPDGMEQIKGARGVSDKQMLGPSRTFGQPVLGGLANPSQATIDKSAGALDSGDLVGVNGIQNWYDKELHGTDGIRIDATWRAGIASGKSTAPNGQVFPVLLTKTDPTSGAAVKLTLDQDWQNKAEAAVADIASPSAVALVQPSTGRILALAVSKSANNQPLANWGQYPPGSTFKIVSTLALIRSGLTPDSKVDCPESVTISGQTIHNYPGYPAEHNGSIPLRDALAFSCNTAFVNATKSLPRDALKKAAASLGLGVDYDAGFESYYGDVPVPDSDGLMAADSFGQGTIQASPMAMAGVVASVAAGHTVIPWFVDGKQLSPAAGVAPLTPDEAKQLQSAMQSVSSYGSTSSVKNILVGGKTGTAEYGPADNIKTHVWLVGYTANDVAVATFSVDGNYGTDLAPVIQKIFS